MTDDKFERQVGGAAGKCCLANSYYATLSILLKGFDGKLGKNPRKEIHCYVFYIALSKSTSEVGKTQ